LVLTLGKLYTDPESHAISKVPGVVSFTIDARSQSDEILDRIERLIRNKAEELGSRRKVRLDLGPITRVKPAMMDEGLRRRLAEGCSVLGLRALDMPSGAGHDAADFANAGVPSAMIFLRNAHGSHNPDEAMEMADFALGAQLLAWVLANSS
jgi:N-carbamoyl-L-amino-acid hydrolase